MSRYVLLCVYNKSVKIIQYNRFFKTEGVYEEANEKTLSMILTLAMILTLTNGYHNKVVKAAVKTQCTTYNGNNIGAQDYTGKQSNYYPGPMKSYLVAQKMALLCECNMEVR